MSIDAFQLLMSQRRFLNMGPLQDVNWTDIEFLCTSLGRFKDVQLFYPYKIKTSIFQTDFAKK